MLALCPRCAIVVTFRPGPQVVTDLDALRPQVDHLIVIDNASSPEDVLTLRNSASHLGFHLLENPSNLGLAAALNQGIRHLQSLFPTGDAAVFLFDQDSAVTPGYTATMLTAFDESPLGPRLAILVPRYVDRRFDIVLSPPVLHDILLHTATTSGSLVPLSVFTQAGLFDERLFLDGLDYEFSLRVRSLGFSIAECPAATLLHAPGDPSFHRLLGSRPFQAANYSHLRRYYQERNKVLVLRRYFPRFLPLFASYFVISFKDLLKIVLVESNKRRKLLFFLRGWRDGLLNRSGKLHDPNP